MLQRQAELSEGVIDDARGQLEGKTNDAGTYSELLVGLIVQGLLKIAEDDCLIR